ncbi:MAG: beta-ketoacyl synthase N-terminal-like domain-containing protein [Gemmataceae bacterium]
MNKNAEPIAIVGMQCLYPGAGGLEAYWSNILRGVEAVREVPPSRWDPEDYDLIQARKRGGFLEGLTSFDPLEYGIMPAAVRDGDPEQFLVYGVVHGALRDAMSGREFRATGVSKPPTPELTSLTPRTEVVIGRGGYNGNTIEAAYLLMEFVAQAGELLSQLVPGITKEKRTEIRKLLASAFPSKPTTEMLASSIPNLTSGRVANRLDFQGGNYTIDAACASGLIATDLVIRALRERRADMGIAAAVHLVQKPYFWFAFELLQALSPSGKCSAYSKAADGLVIGEGVGAVVLKRLDDAVRDGDRIYAVIRAVGTASDGKAMGILTPRQEGQVLATRRAYDECGIDPATVGLIEGHGTAMPVGDATEIATLHEVFGKEGYPAVALSSVKSMLGHLMPAAGMAGLIKAALSVYHRTLPPTLHVAEVHPDLKGSRIYVNTKTRPWILPPDEVRRAGVNAFGFGGINTHAVLEDLPGVEPRESLSPRGSELFTLTASSREELRDRLVGWISALPALESQSLRDVCYTASLRVQESQPVRLAVVASGVADLKAKLERARQSLTRRQETSWHEDAGLAYAEAPYPGKLAILFPGLAFPGLGGGYTERLGELCLHFPAVREYIDFADSFSAHVEEQVGYPLRHQFFPPPLLDAAALGKLERELIWSKRTPLGQMQAALATWNLLVAMGFQAHALAGFSMGEWAALSAAGVLSHDDLRSMLSVWQSLGDVPEQLTGIWGMVGCNAEKVEAVLARVPGTAAIIMDPSPTQTFFAGEVEAVRAALEELRREGVFVQEIPFPAIHTPLAESIVEGLRAMKNAMPANRPKARVYCGMNGQPYPDDPDVIRDWLIDSFKEPLRGKDTVRNMYHNDGVRIFVEVGIGGRSPQSLGRILEGAPHVAIAVDWRGHGGLEQLHQMLSRLFVLGVPFDLGFLYRNRPCREVKLTGPEPASRTALQLELGHPRARVPAEAVAKLRELIVGPAAQEPPGLPRRDEPAGSAPSPMAGVMATMQRFLEVQQHFEASETQMLTGFLAAQQAAMATLFTTAAPARSASEGTVSPSLALRAGLSEGPLVGEVTKLVPGRELEARPVLDVGKHPFLVDHTFIKVPEEIKPAEERSPTLPMTFGLEVICEAAARLVPEMQVVGCHDVEASKWVALISRRQLSLFVRARRLGETEVEVELRPEDQERPAIKGRATLGPALPPAPHPRQVAGDRLFAHTAQDLYTVPFMFHGPSFHVVSKLVATSDSALVAELTLRDPAELFAQPPSPMLLDPVLLDGVGQVLGYKLLQDDWNVYPLRVGRLTRFGPTPPPGAVVRMLGTYKRLDGRRVGWEADVLDPAGRVWLRIEGAQMWRILWPKDLSTFSRQPRDLSVGTSWPTRCPQAVCSRMHARRFGEVSPEWIARYCLRPAEWAAYKASPRFDWLLRRIALKDAARDWFREHRQVVLLHLEIELAEDANGRLRLVSPAEPGLAVDVVGDAEEAVAVCARAYGVGVDVAKGSGASREACAVRAAARALGRADLEQFRVGKCRQDGIVEVTVGGQVYPAETSQDGERVFAVAVVA